MYVCVPVFHSAPRIPGRPAIPQKLQHQHVGLGGKQPGDQRKGLGGGTIWQILVQIGIGEYRYFSYVYITIQPSSYYI